MKNHSITFDSNRIAKSKLLSSVIEATNHLVGFVLIVILLGLINASFLSLLNNYLFYVIYFVVTLLSHWILTITTKVCVSEKKVVIRNPRLFSWRQDVTIQDITKVVVTPYYIPRCNVILITQSKDRILTSIKDTEKFVQLLQELNPNIEVEYKE
jgi:hypothetical protein